VVLVYFSIVTAQYNVFQYYKSGISLAIVGGLSGGITRNGLIYVQNELGGLLHLVLAFLILVVATVWVAMKYGSRATDRLARTRLVAALSSWRGLIALNAICTLDGAGPTATDCSTRRRKSFSSVTRVRSIETKRELVQVSPSAPC
jgi:hypothetical protein